LTIIGLLVVAIGSVGPWVGSTGGLHGDGRITLVAAVVGVVALVLARGRAWGRVIAWTAAAVALGTAEYNFVHIRHEATRVTLVGHHVADVGWGPIATLIGAVAAIAAVVAESVPAVLRWGMTAVACAGAAAALIAGALQHTPTTASTRTTASSAHVAAGVSPAVYVSNVCSVAKGWKGAIQSAGKAFQSGVSTNSLSQAKGAFVAFVGSLLRATARAESKVSAGAAPAISNGEQIKSALVRSFMDARSRLDQTSSQAAALPTTSVSAFQPAANRVVAGIRNSLGGVSGSILPNDPELRAAAAQDRTCRSLGGGR
jgi:hypothetical protein